MNASISCLQAQSYGFFKKVPNVFKVFLKIRLFFFGGGYGVVLEEVGVWVEVWVWVACEDRCGFFWGGIGVAVMGGGCL